MLKQFSRKSYTGVQEKIIEKHRKEDLSSNLKFISLIVYFKITEIY